MEANSFSSRVIKIIQQIPEGYVSTYGVIANLAGSPRASRQVSWILHSSSRKYNLPWHRVVNRKGEISLKEGNGFEEQYLLLQKEGIEFNDKKRIDLAKFGWKSHI